MPEKEQSTSNNSELPSNWKERSAVFRETYPDIYESLYCIAQIDLRLNGQTFSSEVFPCRSNDEECPEIYHYYGM